MDNLRHNETIDTLLHRRSIRAFVDEPIDEVTIATLETVAQRAATSQFLNDWSAIRVEDPVLKEQLAHIGNQPYIATAPLLYVFVIDQHRNALIAANNDASIDPADYRLNTYYRVAQAQNDAILALHAMETAAESLGLGCVILGSVLSDIDRLIDLLHLPQYTYPVLGLAIGKPAQNPARKPRMKREMQIFADRYPLDESALEYLQEFDERVHQYYDLRNAERPVDAFSVQVVEHATHGDREIFNQKAQLQRQGFFWHQ